MLLCPWSISEVRTFQVGTSVIGRLQDCEGIPSFKRIFDFLVCFCCGYTHRSSFMLFIECVESRVAQSDFGSESTTGHYRLSALQMTSAGSEGSSAINLSELIIHAPPPAASEVHTSLGNYEMGASMECRHTFADIQASSTSRDRLGVGMAQGHPRLSNYRSKLG